VVPRAVTIINAQTKTTKTQTVKFGLMLVIVLIQALGHGWPKIAANHAFVSFVNIP
jgi:hypothetical protein